MMLSIRFNTVLLTHFNFLKEYRRQLECFDRTLVFFRDSYNLKTGCEGPDSNRRTPTRIGPESIT